MQKQQQTFSITNFITIKQQLLHWSSQYNSCSFLDNHQYQQTHHNIECIAAVDALQFFHPIGNGVAAFNDYLNNTKDWLFGHISFDYSKELYPSNLPNYTDNIGFAAISFFQPAIVVQLSKHEISIESYHEHPKAVLKAILETTIPTISKLSQVQLQSKISKADYLHTVQQLQNHIARGDCYEINFCQEFYDHKASIQPVEVYERLTEISPNPFACYYKQNHQHVICASPERFLRKTNQTLISQPIKGTSKRNLENPIEDTANKIALLDSAKERSENVMVVDLVRNDLSKICTEGSVEVEELFGIYSFPQVHQMISTIKGILNNTTDFLSIINATFPMGSMTGAPKKKVLELIHTYEKSNRGLYSGAVGYITPTRDFDFNVVIRSILYNSQNNYLSYHVGSGITFNSNPEEEYEECNLKASAMVTVLTASNS